MEEMDVASSGFNLFLNSDWEINGRELCALNFPALLETSACWTQGEGRYVGRKVRSSL